MCVGNHPVARKSCLKSSCVTVYMVLQWLTTNKNLNMVLEQIETGDCPGISANESLNDIAVYRI